MGILYYCLRLHLLKLWLVKRTMEKSVQSLIRSWKMVLKW
jgi:hypothetical protein